MTLPFVRKVYATRKHAVPRHLGVSATPAATLSFRRRAPAEAEESAVSPGSTNPVILSGREAPAERSRRTNLATPRTSSSAGIRLAEFIVVSGITVRAALRATARVAGTASVVQQKGQEPPVRLFSGRFFSFWRLPRSCGRWRKPAHCSRSAWQSALTCCIMTICLAIASSPSLPSPPPACSP
jgi:hypothetical protein